MSLAAALMFGPNPDRCSLVVFRHGVVRVLHNWGCHLRISSSVGSVGRAPANSCGQTASFVNLLSSLGRIGEHGSVGVEAHHRSNLKVLWMQSYIEAPVLILLVCPLTDIFYCRVPNTGDKTSLPLSQLRLENLDRGRGLTSSCSTNDG